LFTEREHEPDAHESDTSCEGCQELDRDPSGPAERTASPCVAARTIKMTITLFGTDRFRAGAVSRNHR
jgi:hypothetical protein